ncbi:hypothetical protein [Rheinheimera sp. 1928-s]|uniref:hypothetical protein n=1 Tax=Rheinheimera sp. 1928-s TaxID=3033803 RepID=UPI0026361FBF|nr:hypothetical protein [Rheinheimera sp. 1928-s]MDF3127387.1 hypothetical protein [Rheinheimera sp. 1928-s]
MKVSITCPTCEKENVPSEIHSAVVDISDDGHYEFKCPNGHTSVTHLQLHGFEILFDIGAEAIIDGYYREAISSFTSALERFYEFFIKVVCASKGHDWNTIQELWKSVSNQSERQLGAYMFLYLQETGKNPPLLSDKKVQLRNSVIHKGKLSNKEQAIEYGQNVLDVIRPTLRMLKTDYIEGIHTTMTNHMSNMNKISDKGKRKTVIWLLTIVSIAYGEPGHDLRDLIDMLVEGRQGMSIKVTQV